jgi:hypothetical protein
MKPADRRLIQDMLSETSEELYASIAPYVRAPQKAPRRPAAMKPVKLAAPKLSKAGYAAKGRAGFKRIAPDLFKVICIKWQYCEKKENSLAADRIALVAVVADAIAGYCGAIPPLTIAVLLVKMGLSRFCRCYERTERPKLRAFK